MHISTMLADSASTLLMSTGGCYHRNAESSTGSQSPVVRAHCTSGELFLTLPEVMFYVLPSHTSLIMKHILAIQMGGRWRALLDTTEHQPRTIRNYRDKLVTLQAIPALIAMNNVREWLPGAVNMLRAEIIELANSMQITAETIVAFNNAPTHDDDDIL